ncbi:MAG: glycoside hydrolase family 36 protein [Succinivibrionaceae bacterium]
MLMDATTLLESIKSFSEKKSIKIAEVDRSEIVFLIPKSVCVGEKLVLFKDIVADPDTLVYGEGFQMLSQRSGTFRNFRNVGRCPDDEYPYCLEKNETNGKTAYNYIIYYNRFELKWVLVGFSSSFSHVGQFLVFPDGSIEISILLEGNEFNKNENYFISEYFLVLEDSSRQNLLKIFAIYLNKHHKKLNYLETTPKGWCSWYWFYANVSCNDIFDNLNNMDYFKDYNVNLDFLQIDDGYQKHIGDWLIPGDKFPLGLKHVVDVIKQKGKEPAIWVAPFIASKDSELFKNHPEYFAKDKDGNVVSSDQVYYQGWRETPWYMLDFSNEEVQEYIKKVFTYFYKELNIKYFKLDACAWGAIKGLRFKSGISRIENYRLGMEIINTVVGDDAFILGCNAPMWPSLGLFHGMRITDDVERNVKRFAQLANEQRYRLWMNRELWLNDPDCLCLFDLNNQKADFYDYKLHLCTILLSNGIFMLGDQLSLYKNSYQLEFIKKILMVYSWNKKVLYNDELNHFIITNIDTNERIEIYYNFDICIKKLQLGDCIEFFEEIPLKTYILYENRAVAVYYKE